MHRTQLRYLTSLRQLLAACCALLTLATRLSAAAEIDFIVGYDGVASGEGYCPVRVTVDNTAPTSEDFRGTVAVAKIASATNIVVPGVVRDINIAKGDKRTYWLYLPVDGTYSNFAVTLSNERGNVVKSLPATLRIVPAPDNNIVLALSADGSFAPRAGRLPEMPECVVRSLTPDNLPDRWIGYTAAKCVLIDEVTMDMRDSGKIEALLDYVRMGGHLVVFSGRNGMALNASPLGEVWPIQALKEGRCEVTATSVMPLPKDIGRTGPEIESFAELVPKAGAKVVSRLGDSPLVVRGNFGLGHVDVVAIDARGRAFQRLNFSESLWVLATTNSSVPAVAFGDNWNVIDSKPEWINASDIASMPSITAVGGILICYLFIVGPLNFLILIRMRRLELAWVTVPVIVGLFSFGIYFTGASIKGGKELARGVALTVYGPDGAAVREEFTEYYWSNENRLSTFSAATPDEIVLPPQGDLNTGRYRGSRPSDDFNAFTSFDARGVSRISVSVAQWAFAKANFVKSSSRNATTREVVVSCAFDAATGYTGTITNNTTSTLKNITVAAPRVRYGTLSLRSKETSAVVDRIEPGQTAEFNFLGRSQPIQSMNNYGAAYNWFSHVADLAASDFLNSGLIARDELYVVASASNELAWPQRVREPISEQWGTQLVCAKATVVGTTFSQDGLPVVRTISRNVSPDRYVYNLMTNSNRTQQVIAIAKLGIGQPIVTCYDAAGLTNQSTVTLSFATSQNADLVADVRNFADSKWEPLTFVSKVGNEPAKKTGPQQFGNTVNLHLHFFASTFRLAHVDPLENRILVRVRHAPNPSGSPNIAAPREVSIAPIQQWKAANGTTMSDTQIFSEFAAVYQ